ncbi:MAG TPA: hypothetical protein VNB49_00195 [Candidatus Dormibacteraeota bacterium]|nr:hypothetical protein [Candidatus Dormibacteraeota bacterium]
MMDVPAADKNVMERANIVRGRISHRARKTQCKKEPDRSKEQAALRTIPDMLVKQLAHPWKP